MNTPSSLVSRLFLRAANSDVALVNIAPFSPSRAKYASGPYIVTDMLLTMRQTYGFEVDPDNFDFLEVAN